MLNKITKPAFRFGCSCILLATSSFSFAEDAPLSEKAFPDVYKLVAENEHFRVVEATWQPGQKDAMHSHPPAVIYFINDCELSAAIPNGNPIDGKQKAGTSRINPAVSSHIATNKGKTVCKALLVERK